MAPIVIQTNPTYAEDDDDDEEEANAVQPSSGDIVLPSSRGGPLCRIQENEEEDEDLVEEDMDSGSPWPDRRFVRFGSKARAWILLETVPVGFEIWRQFNGFPPTTSPPPMARTEGVEK